MGREAGWERVGELSHMLQSFRHIYLRGEIEDDDQSTVRWQSDLLLFLKVYYDTILVLVLLLCTIVVLVVSQQYHTYIHTGTW